ncbi:MAG: hypothetical protein IJL25_09930 [Clostridia bacterium]|nr:hypothetical protein [Clostridia bacterium]
MIRRKELRSEYVYYDLAAAAAGTALFLLLLFTAKYGVSDVDECFYLTVPQRILKGDRLIVDEWNLSQFTYLFTLPFYRLYTRLNGGTEGIVLASRYLFISFQIPVYCFLYRKLRRYKAAAVLAAVSFCAMVPQTMLALSYYTISTPFVLFVGLILFTDEKRKKPAALFFTGVLLAIAVMTEPTLILPFGVWFVFTVIRDVLGRKGRSFMRSFDFAPDLRAFLWMSAGAAAVFAVFIAVLIKMGSFSSISLALPYLFTGKEYNAGNLLDLKRLWNAFRYYGAVFPLGLFLCLAAAAFLNVRKEKMKKWRPEVLVCAFVLLTACYVTAGIRTLKSTGYEEGTLFCQAHNIPVLVFAPTIYLLREKKDNRNFCILLMGLCYTLIVDLFSEMMLSAGGGIVRTALLIDLFALARELRTDLASAQNRKHSMRKNNRKPLQAAIAALAVCAAAGVVFHSAFVYVVAFYQPPERLLMRSAEKRDAEITAGPYKGLKTIPRVKQICDDTMEDLDIIRRNADGASVTIMDLNCWMYLYLDMPFATFSAWYENETVRQHAYWKLTPEHEPDYLYIPFYDCFFFSYPGEAEMRMKLEQTLRYVEGETTEGKAGYIIKVSGVKP